MIKCDMCGIYIVADRPTIPLCPNCGQHVSELSELDIPIGYCLEDSQPQPDGTHRVEVQLTDPPLPPGARVREETQMFRGMPETLFGFPVRVRDDVPNLTESDGKDQEPG